MNDQELMDLLIVLMRRASEASTQMAALVELLKAKALVTEDEWNFAVRRAEQARQSLMREAAEQSQDPASAALFRRSQKPLL